MQIIDLELSHSHFFCPVTGECILLENEPINENATSLLGYWTSESFSEPRILHSDLQDAVDVFFENHREKQKNENDDEESNPLDEEDLDAFLENHEAPNWAVFRITTRGMASGPIGSTVWLVIDTDN